jgi:hypothetical protein
MAHSRRRGGKIKVDDFIVSGRIESNSDGLGTRLALLDTRSAG